MTKDELQTMFDRCASAGMNLSTGVLVGCYLTIDQPAEITLATMIIWGAGMLGVTVCVIGPTLFKKCLETNPLDIDEITGWPLVTISKQFEDHRDK